MQKYTVNQFFVSNILNWVQEKEIAIPEIQRPFVWDSTKVRFSQSKIGDGGEGALEVFF